MDIPRIAIMWRADWRAPQTETHYQARLAPIGEALSRAGAQVEMIAYREEETEKVRAALLECRAVLVWINPIAEGRDRRSIDALLRETARHGVAVSAHPDVIQKMGAKDVLYKTRALGWGSDVELYQTHSEFDERFRAALMRGPRVLKPLRGNDGRNVIRIEASAESYNVRHAHDDSEEQHSLEGLARRVEALFAQGGSVIDQECHQSLGMVRCYMSKGHLVGFAEQSPRNAANGFAMSGAKTMHRADAEKFSFLRHAMEEDWTPGLMRLLQIEPAQLPLLWDADFLWRARPASSPFALCEINASCVSPFPPDAPPIIAANVMSLIGRG
jgi:hypothetical protein